jgi:heme/copper-type cytochrome/quinol oxidase subunit 2
MIDYLNAWSRYLDPQFWWMHLMSLVWLIFTLVLFVFEPLFLHQLFQRLAMTNSDQAFQRLQAMHILLLTISLIAIAGVMVGAHGYAF